MMKKNVSKFAAVNVNFRKLVLMALVTASTVLTTQAHSYLPATGGNEIDVKPKGLVQNEMIFNINFINVNSDKLNIKIVDQDGTNLYKEIFYGKKMNKTFKVDSEYSTVYLYINNTIDNTEQKFVISNKEGEKVLITTVF
ncbi:MAG: hypothetical protein WKF89_15830 [Chitinophagaceae bacterium]